jgi:hypothetical protein
MPQLHGYWSVALRSQRPRLQHRSRSMALGRAKAWAENYISFDRRNTESKRVVADPRQKTHAGMAPQDFFTVLETMIEPMGDLH